LEIRSLRVGEADSLVRCFERGYGRSYVDAAFYDAAEIEARIASGRLHSVVAVADDGEIVGHMGIVRVHPDALTVEAGHTVVDPRHRGAGLAGRLGARLSQICRDDGRVGFLHYPTTAHPVMQRLATHSGIETGLMLAYIPAATDYRGLAQRAGERWAATVVFQALREVPEREVFMPARYARLIGSIYARTGLSRTTHPPTSAATDAATLLDAEDSPRRGLLRVRVRSIGNDIDGALERTFQGAAVDVLQLDLPLADPGIGVAVAAASQQGFRFSAVLPEYDPGDVLRLQALPRARGPLDAPGLVTDHAKSLLAAIRADKGGATSLPIGSLEE
jgi:GNAT superfamily N-acetyltransferase